MIDLSLLAGAVQSLKAAGDIAKGIKTLSDEVAIQSRVVDLQSAIMDAQAKTLDAQAAQGVLIEEIRELKKKLEDFNNWAALIEGYALNDFGRQQFAYIYRGGGEQPHRICANCVELRRKSILHYVGDFYGTDRFKCYGCNSQFDFQGRGAQDRSAVLSDYDPV